ncbi:hypothetical protein PLESTB_000521900 [Pleodorina starrii]|uniref:J domain-containing protein n=1 Tax=Pleodorina starrii TaxID=330485 RepID=A0A9W6BGB5_9CHLO|nr:hypothetical protein PLESTB_000521900 [Pleodorina starrii]
MQHSGTGRETGLVDDEDDDLISWRLHLERQRQLAAERAEQMDLLRAYRERRQAERRAEAELRAARATAELRQRQRQGQGQPHANAAGEEQEWSWGREGRPGTGGTASGSSSTGTLRMWQEIEARWAALDRLLQDERPALRAGDAAARVPGGAAADEVVVVAEQAPHHGGPMLQLGDIPWPPSTSGMLHGLAQLEAQRSGPGASPASPRALLRRAYLSAVRRWHPDKSAAVLAALPPGDRAAARARLLAVCQELNRQHEEALRQQL